MIIMTWMTMQLLIKIVFNDILEMFHLARPYLNPIALRMAKTLSSFWPFLVQ